MNRLWLLRILAALLLTAGIVALIRDDATPAIAACAVFGVAVRIAQRYDRSPL